MAEVTGDWMNSDSAISIAEKGGGREFRLNKMTWQPKNITSGVYFFEMIYNCNSHKKSLIYIK